MTTEQLLEKSDQAYCVNDTTRVIRLDDILEFFEANVCIQKGANRHPCADVLHRIAEGEQGQSKLSSSISPWEDVSYTCDEYRIKPKEPTYEYLWYKEDGETAWGTIKEWESFGLLKWYQAAETKRIRQ